MRCALLYFFLSVLSLISNANEPLPSQLPPEQETAALRSAEETGLSIFRHDRAVWIATDAVMNMPAFKDNPHRKGWVTRDRGDEIEVTFVADNKDKQLHALYRIGIGKDWKVAGSIIEPVGDAPLSEYEASAASALNLAMATNPALCGSHYNPVVLPIGADSDRWAVYLIPGTTSKNVIPMGGAYRIEVNTRTKETVSRKFSLSCIELDASNEPGNQLEALIVTHLLDAVPTEIHVFWNLWSDIPMLVSTAPYGTVWGIEKGKIRLLKRKIKQQ